MASDMWTGWGIRTLAATHPAFNPYNYQTGSVWPHDNAMIAMGFKYYGETSQSQQAQFPVTDVFSYVEVADGRVWMRPEGVACFAGDLPEEEQKLVWATHAAPAADLFNQKVEGTAWRSKPSWYIVATKDRTVQPELQHFVAKRMGAITVETASSHVPMLSNPALVLDVIRKAANAVQKA